MNIEKKIARFWSKVDIRSKDECWEYQGARYVKGYGKLRFDNKLNYAHRFSAKIAGMDIEGNLVCHHCDNPPCVNPNHLFIGTYLDNTRDMISKGRQNFGGKSVKKVDF